MHIDAFVKYLQENLLTSPAAAAAAAHTYFHHVISKRKECGACGHEMHLELSVNARAGNTLMLFFRSLPADT